ncbi:sugar ABC transporter substrate-binding protein [Nibricoccus aquaticus]|uniref:Sugar ABC transporter substrate-binding protein n=1 Tax=Nibricoccus aquaticus TaxID=2576891 RepID=A0A290QDU8_9BACT|nr:substrate-binding domain-containing protein [Nibricoccus aquaticus]ATC64426.1 sugar ABC transporter substrate-binding protein [Nibricoccus aquaticus]
MKKSLLSLLTLSLTLSTAAFAQDITLAVIPKGTTHPFWKTVEAGARKAAEETGVKINWRGPILENDRAQQIAVVQQFVGSKVSGIVLAPLDATALVGPVRSATDAKIPVIIMDSALNGEAGKEFSSFVATDNRRGGEIGGEELARLLNGKGKVVLLRYIEGSASTNEREEGFLSVMKKHPGIEVIMSNRYAGPSISTAQDAAMNMIDKIREADGIFCPNDPSTQGMLLALRQNGLAGKKKFVGFDTSSQLVAALKRDQIDAIVAQNPFKMGYLSVKTAVAVIRGEKFEARVDTGCELVTKANLDSPAVKAILGGE